MTFILENGERVFDLCTLTRHVTKLQQQNDRLVRTVVNILNIMEFPIHGNDTMKQVFTHLRKDLLGDDQQSTTGKDTQEQHT